jgi:hypothetical protein
MSKDRSDSPQSQDAEELTTPKTHEEASRQVDTRRDEMRELVKEMDQEVADSEQRRSDRGDQ